jgi:hypothetical protein
LSVHAAVTVDPDVESNTAGAPSTPFRLNWPEVALDDPAELDITTVTEPVNGVGNALIAIEHVVPVTCPAVHVTGDPTPLINTVGVRAPPPFDVGAMYVRFTVACT